MRRAFVINRLPDGTYAEAAGPGNGLGSGGTRVCRDLPEDVHQGALDAAPAKEDPRQWRAVLRVPSEVVAGEARDIVPDCPDACTPQTPFRG
jgi:hypothetical protein